MTKEECLELLLAAYTGDSSTEEGSFAGDVLRACADGMAKLWSMEVDGLERRAFVSTAIGDWLTKVCADRGVERREGEDDETLRQRTLERLAAVPASGNADHYAAWCMEADGILRVRVLPLHRGNGTVDIVAVGLDGRCPTEEAIAQAQAVVDANRPIGADAQVLGAEEKAVDVSATVTLTGSRSLAEVQADFTASLADLLRQEALRSATVRYALLLRLLLETEGVEDVPSFTLNGSAAGVALGDTEAAVPGTVTLTEGNA